MSFSSSYIYSSANPAAAVFLNSNPNVQVFSDAKAMKIMVHPNATEAVHPLEFGTSIIDNRILNPIELELLLYLPPALYKTLYQEINDLFINAILLNVQSKTSVYPSMLISSMPHDEETDSFNAIWMHIKMHQVLFANTTSSSFAPSSPNNNSTVPRGALPQNPATPKQVSTISPYYKKIPNFLGGLFG